MNVAFSTLLTLLLILPGLIFHRIRRCSGEFAHIIPAMPQPFSAEIGTSIIVAVLIHMFCVAVVYCLVILGVPNPKRDSILMLLLGKFGVNDALFNDVLSSVVQHPFAIACYFLFSCATGAISGRLVAQKLERLIRHYKLHDARERTTHEWDDFFRLKSTEGALVTAVCQMGSECYLFLGLLVQIHFNPSTGELDRLELTNVSKRPLQAIGEKPPFSDVYGDKFILRTSEIITLNVSYIVPEEQPLTQETENIVK